MVLKIFLLIAAVGFCVGDDTEIKSNFYREEPCAEEHGFCLLENECPHKVEKEFKELCSSQKDQGAVCCKNFPQEKVNCRQTHNECMRASCPINLGKRGCLEGELCCVLL